MTTDPLEGALWRIKHAAEEVQIASSTGNPTLFLDKVQALITKCALLDQIIAAAKEIKEQSEIGNDRHQTGCIEQDHTLVCSGVSMMEKARTAQANMFATITKEQTDNE